MSLVLALQNSVSGLLTAQGALNTVTNNVSNVNTEGYTRKTIKQESVALAGVGAGVKLTTITRFVDENLLKTLRAESSTLGENQVLNDFFGRMQNLFGEPADNDSVSAQINALANAFETLALDPEKAAPQLDVVDAAQRLARELNDMTERIQDMRFDADKAITDAVEDVNTLLGDIAELNDKIVRETNLERPTAELEDRRDVALDKLSKLLDIRFFAREDGDIAIYTTAGRSLLESTARELTHTPVAVMDPSRSYNSGDPVNGTIKGIFVDDVTAANDITGVLRSGRIRGLVTLRDRHLVNLQDQIEELASSLADEINTLHNQGAGLPPAQTLTGTRGGLTGATTIQPDSSSGTYGSIRVAITDKAGALDGAALDLDLDALRTATVGAGNPLTVQNVVDALNGSVAGINGLPDVVSSATGNLSGNFAAIQNGKLAISVSSGFGVAIDERDSTIDDGTKSRGFSKYFGLNDFFVFNDSSNVAATIAVRSDIEKQPSLMSRGKLQEEPAGSGKFFLSPGADSIARDIAAKFDEKLSFPLVGELPAADQSFEDFAAQLLAFNANLAKNAKRDADFQEALHANLKFKADSVSGVNVDEELTSMLKFEQAFNASARVLQSIQDMLQVLDNLVR